MLQEYQPNVGSLNVSYLNVFTIMGLFKVFCWALIFIRRLRFPTGLSIAMILKNLRISVLSFSLPVNVSWRHSLRMLNL